MSYTLQYYALQVTEYIHFNVMLKSIMLSYCHMRFAGLSWYFFINLITDKTVYDL